MANSIISLSFSCDTYDCIPSNALRLVLIVIRGMRLLFLAMNSALRLSDEMLYNDVLYTVRV